VFVELLCRIHEGQLHHRSHRAHDDADHHRDHHHDHDDHHPGAAGRLRRDRRRHQLLVGCYQVEFTVRSTGSSVLSGWTTAFSFTVARPQAST
jgi:hypothetical protein